MPKVPTLDTSRVSPQALPTPYSNVAGREGEGLMALGRGISQLGEGAERAYAKAKKEADDFRTDEADLAFGREVNALLHDKDKGFLNQLGEGALDPASHLEAMQKRAKEIHEGLANDEQRRRFGMRAAARLDQANVSMERHSAGQRLKVYEAISEGQKALALETVAADPSAVDSAVGKVLVGPDGEPGPLRRYLTKLGLPAEQIQVSERRFMGQAYVAGVQKLVDARNWRAAETMLAKGKAVLPGAAAKQLEASIAAARRKDLGDAVAASAVINSRRENGSVDRDAALKKAQQLAGGMAAEDREAAMELLDEHLAREDRAWNARVSQYYNRALGAYDQRFSAKDINPNDEAWLRQNAAEDWRKLTDIMRRDAEHFRAQRERGTRQPETDEQRDAFIRFRADVMANPEKYRGLAVEDFAREWRHQLSSRDYEAAGALFTKTKQDDPVTVSDFSRFVSEEIAGTPALRGSKKKADQFRALMGDARRDFKAKHGKEPTFEDYSAIRDTVWEKKETWFGLSSETVLKERSGVQTSPPAAPGPRADYVTVTRKRDGVARRMRRQDAARFASSADYEVR